MWVGVIEQKENFLNKHNKDELKAVRLSFPSVYSIKVTKDLSVTSQIFE